MKISEEIRDVAMRIEMMLPGSKQPSRDTTTLEALASLAEQFQPICPYCYEAATRLVEHARSYCDSGRDLTSSQLDRLKLDMRRELHSIRIKAGHWEMRGN